MPWTSLFFTSWPASISAPATTLLAITTPWPPTPTINRPRVASANPRLPSGDRQDRAGRAHLGADGATGACACIDRHLPALVEPLIRPRDRGTAEVHAELARD